MAKDLSNLKSKASNQSKRAPDEPHFTRQLMENWLVHKYSEPERPTVLEGQPWRPSDAGGCERSYWYKAQGTPETDPMDAPGFWSTTLGQLIHDWFEVWMPVTYPGIEMEKEFVLTLPGTDIEIGGHSDAFHPDLDGMRVAFELKSINGTGYRRAGRGGPRESAEIQGAIAAKAMDADLLVIVYAALEVSSPAVAKKNGYVDLPFQQMISEWSTTPDVFLPMADEELARVALSIQGEKSARRPLDIPVTAEITDPMTGTWFSHNDDGVPNGTGASWRCNYCRYQQHCKTDPT
jgi:hypothetical protein